MTIVIFGVVVILALVFGEMVVEDNRRHPPIKE